MSSFLLANLRYFLYVHPGFNQYHDCEVGNKGGPEYGRGEGAPGVLGIDATSLTKELYNI